MTPEEAIKILNDTPVEISSGSKTTTREYSQMLHLAENALEKQIPKKPIPAEEQNIWCAMRYSCPSCGKHFTAMIADYCYVCGQALDWRETE